MDSLLPEELFGAIVTLLADRGLLPRRPEEEFHPNELDLPRTNTRVAVVHGTVGDVLDHTGLGYTYA